MREGVATAVRALLAELAADDWGQVATSYYDTARLVALAPWLEGHAQRVAHLLATQRPDGAWGGPDGYALVPTLSAVTALLAESRRVGGDRLLPAVRSGLAAARRWLDPARPIEPPDTVGVEVGLPALVEELRARLTDSPAAATLPPLPPTAVDTAPLVAMRRRAASGTLSPRAWACLEVLGAEAVAARWVRPAMGAVGCSPAATAAWAGGPLGDRGAVDFLHRLQRRGGGPVPAVTPITYFEPAWVLNSLAVGGLTVPVPGALLDRLEAGVTEQGAPAAPGLPADADDTAAVLAALHRHGRPRRPDVLLDYRTDGHFACFLDERNPSVSANAHVLETLALWLAARPEERGRFGGPAATAARWLLAQQGDDGAWWDKWHASPYYATACCALALLTYGREELASVGPAVGRAVDWLRATQRPDGSWGRWRGTAEETAYAVLTLAVAAPRLAAVEIRRGCAALADPSEPDETSSNPGDGRDPGDPPAATDPPLWHAKDLYTPVAVVRAARLAALAAGRAATGTD